MASVFTGGNDWLESFATCEEMNNLVSFKNLWAKF